MANLHTRSNSYPSQSHPLVDDVEDHLRRLKSSAEATSTSAAAICSNLASLRDLHESINDMIQMPSIQQSLSGEELLEGSLRLVDLCEFSREIVCSTKESVQQLESSVRRNKGETATTYDINSYVASTKKINKMVNKYCIKNLKSSNQKDNQDLNAIELMLKETETVGFTILKSILMLVSGDKEIRSKQRSWSFLSKFAQTSRVHTEAESNLEKLKEKEMSIQEIEEGLEALFRSLVKTRVSILNVHSQ